MGVDNDNGGEADELRLAEEAWKSLQPGRRPNALRMTASHTEEDIAAANRGHREDESQ